MNKLYPDSLAGRTLLVLIVGLTLSHVLSLGLYLTDRTNALALAGEEHVGERIATIVQLVENSPPEDWGRIVELANNPQLQVSLTGVSAIDVHRGDNWQSGVLHKSMAAHLAHAGEHKFHTRYMNDNEATNHAAHPRTSNHGADEPKTILVSLQLPDDAWLNFAVPIKPSETLWSMRFTISMGVMIFTIVILSLIVVHYMNAPLARFARASERLGVDVNAPPLPEIGPLEVRRATSAFNRMQDRVRRFIDDRTQLVAAITHDLRTPITRLRLRAELVEDSEQHNKMLSDLDEMERIIDSTLSFARDDAKNEPRQTVDLLSLLQTVCDDLADSGSEVEFQSQGRLPYICRPVALRRAFTNLIENAVKYGLRSRVSLTNDEEWIVILIEDEGPGIPEDRQEDAFKPFQRLEESRNRETGGTGLGLTLARTIIRGHGGDVTLLNRLEGGLRVEVRLPCDTYNEDERHKNSNES